MRLFFQCCDCRICSKLEQWWCSSPKAVEKHWECWRMETPMEEEQKKKHLVWSEILTCMYAWCRYWCAGTVNYWLWIIWLQHTAHGLCAIQKPFCHVLTFLSSDSEYSLHPYINIFPLDTTHLIACTLFLSVQPSSRSTSLVHKEWLCRMSPTPNTGSASETMTWMEGYYTCS